MINSEKKGVSPSSGQKIYLSFESAKYFWLSCVCEVIMQFNVCGLLVLLIQKSSPFFLSLWSSVSLSIPMLQSPWLSITGRRNGGVWGKWWRLHTHTQFLFCSLCCFLICCTFWCFAFLHFFLTLLLSCQTDFKFNLLGLLLLRSWSMRAVKWLMIVWDYRPGLLLSFQKGFIYFLCLEMKT